MARPQKYNDEEILRVAAEVFLEHGAAASTAMIARQAGVSEGILFKRFKNKEALFAAALTVDTESDRWRQVLLDSVGKGSPQENLKQAIVALFTKLENLIPKFMILEGQGKQRPPFPSGAKAPPMVDAEAISSYLQGEVKAGRITISRPDLHAHEIVGAVVHCTMMKLRHQMEVCSVEEWAEHLAATHLAPGKAPRKTSTPRAR